jgi:hypothetical protein
LSAPPPAAVPTPGKLGIAAIVVVLNVGVVAYFVFQIAKEVVRNALDLEEIEMDEVLRLLENRVWPIVAYMDGACPLGSCERWRC